MNVLLIASVDVLVGVRRVGGGLSRDCQYSETLVHLLVSGMHHLLVSGAMLLHPASMAIQHLLHALVARHEHHDRPGEGSAFQDRWYDQRFPW